eukprot:symbB.v1.2.028574.t1/scaffold3036.1/size64867/4
MAPNRSGSSVLPWLFVIYILGSGPSFGVWRWMAPSSFREKAMRCAKGFGEEVREAKTHEQQYQSKKGRKSTEDAIRFHEEARSLREKGDLAAAVKLYRKARVAISRAAGKGSKDFARVCNDLAQTYFELGQHERAEELFEESRASFSSAVGEEHAEYAGCLQNLARTKLKLNRLNDAEALYKEASQIYVADLKANHVAYVHTLRSLASLYQSVGQVHMVQPLLLERLSAGSCRDTDLGQMQWQRRWSIWAIFALASGLKRDEIQPTVGFSMLPPVYRGNVEQEIPWQLVLTECASCTSAPDHLEVPWSHPTARCLRQAQSFLQPTALDATQTLGGIPYGPKRFEVLHFARSCAMRHGRLFWVLLMATIQLGEPKLGDTRNLMLLCVPRPCSASTVGQWISPWFVHQGKLEGVVKLQNWQPACRKPLHLALQHRPAFHAKSVMDAQDLRRGEDVPPWPLFWMRPEPEGPGSEPKAAEDEVEPVILVNLPQPYPRRVHHAGTTISGGGVAVLFAGSWRYEERTVATVARHVVMPLQAVVLAALSGSGPGRLEHWQMKRFFPALAGFQWVRDPTIRQLREAIAPKSLLLYETFGGGAISPLRRSKLGGALFSLQKLQMVLHMTRQYERKRRRRFRWLIYSRLDLIWVANHPPVRLMDEDALWAVPLGGVEGHKAAYFAVNDLHGVVPRHLAEIYFGRWKLLRRGVIFQPLLEPEELLASICWWMKLGHVRCHKFV